VDPNDIFNMFFGGGMPGGMHTNGMGGGFRVYSNGFGGGQRPGQGQRQRGQGQAQEQQQQGGNGMQLLQMIPILLLFLFSIFSSGGETAQSENKYFKLYKQTPYHNPLQTRITTVKDIPFFVTDKFMRTYARDRYQLAQVERMVERDYKEYLVKECKTQQRHLQTMEKELDRNRRNLSDADRERSSKRVREYEMTRCAELKQLYGNGR